MLNITRSLKYIIKKYNKAQTNPIITVQIIPLKSFDISIKLVIPKKIIAVKAQIKKSFIIYT